MTAQQNDELQHKLSSPAPDRSAHLKPISRRSPVSYLTTLAGNVFKRTRLGRRDLYGLKHE
ncbi:hypothetical protein LTR57_025655 [Friedmanniomyces endolithicus]|nr:hypothetical protein LTR57_025655 [Friedmanniomyces endolithicus]KAK0949576.1 hypothetical protein LTS01_025788 [Friedmanniomyces endolithicus]